MQNIVSTFKFLLIPELLQIKIHGTITMHSASVLCYDTFTDCTSSQATCPSRVLHLIMMELVCKLLGSSLRLCFGALGIAPDHPNPDCKQSIDIEIAPPYTLTLKDTEAHFADHNYGKKMMN